MNALVIFRMDMDIVESVQSGDSSPCLIGRILLKVLLFGLVFNVLFCFSPSSVANHDERAVCCGRSDGIMISVTLFPFRCHVVIITGVLHVASATH